MTQVNFVPAFSSRTNLKLHIIVANSTLVKKVIINFDSSEPSGTDCIPVVVLKNCEPEFSYIPVGLFYMYLRESCFPD